jgi:hypothetical protein
LGQGRRFGMGASPPFLWEDGFAADVGGPNDSDRNGEDRA